MNSTDRQNTAENTSPAGTGNAPTDSSGNAPDKRDLLGALMLGLLADGLHARRPRW